MSALATLAAELRGIPQFADLNEDAMEWLASHMQVVELEAGQQFFAAGSPADRMVVMLEGELRSVGEGGRGHRDRLCVTGREHLGNASLFAVDGIIRGPRAR